MMANLKKGKTMGSDVKDDIPVKAWICLDNGQQCRSFPGRHDQPISARREDV